MATPREGRGIGWGGAAACTGGLRGGRHHYARGLEGRGTEGRDSRLRRVGAHEGRVSS